MKIKIVLQIFVFLFFNVSFLQAQPNNIKEKEFLKTCTDIAKAYVKRDVKKINSFIHLKTGIYLTYNPGVEPTYMHLHQLNKRIMTGDLGFPESKNIELHHLHFDTTFIHDCDNGSGWNKYGAFVNAHHKFTDLSSVMELNLMNTPEDMVKELKKLKKDIKLVKIIEKSSRLVVFNQKDMYLEFYMTMIDNKWYLTFIDFRLRCEIF